MGKVKKQKTPVQKTPLEEDILNAKFAKSKNRTKFRLQNLDEEEFVDSKLTKKIINAARSQQKEIEGAASQQTNQNASAINFSYMDTDEESDDESSNFGDSNTFFEDIVIDEEDEKAVNAFMSKNPLPRRMLFDIIKEKQTENKTEIDTRFSVADSIELLDVDPKVKELYEGVKNVLEKYRSGKLPKGFKILPKVPNWEQLLNITAPDKWSAAAMYQATRIFASNLTEKKAENFFGYVLLPRIRDDLQEYKRLNFHLYQALRKALLKPGAFMKGILLPLLQSGDCTLREAIIVGSIVSKYSIPILHSSAAILKIAEMDYTGPNSIFLRIFFDKKYALPYKVVDACVAHFQRFQNDHRELPVLWHQSLLSFVQRYKNDILTEQKKQLLKLLEKHYHPTISPEIRRELEHAQCRDIQDNTSMELE